MDDQQCGVCQSPYPCRVLCKCGQALCKVCAEHILSQAVNPHCPLCDNSISCKSLGRNPSKQELFTKRVIQRNLVYLIGIPPCLANESVLSKTEYFGQYGKIRKCVVNKNNPYNSPSGLSYRAYINYVNEVEATLCIKACDNFTIGNMQLKATYGTTKYCNYFLNGNACPKTECLYLHEFGSCLDTFTREEIQKNQHMQPHNSIFMLLKVNISLPVGTMKLPSVTLVKNRQFCSDITNKVPRRKDSRFGFNEDSGETAVKLPEYLEDLCNKCSPMTRVARVPTEQANELFKETWATDIFQFDWQTGQLVFIKGI